MMMKFHSEIPFRIHVDGEYRHPGCHGATASSPIGLLLTSDDVRKVREHGPIRVSIRSRHTVEFELAFDREDGPERLCLVTSGFRIPPDTASISEIIRSFGI